MGTKKRQQRLRAKLYALNPYCPQCGIKMILSDDIPKVTLEDKRNGKRGIIGNLKYHPSNLCTLEYPITRLEPNKRRNNKQRLTILCKKCNENNARAVELRIGIDEIRKRSGN